MAIKTRKRKKAKAPKPLTAAEKRAYAKRLDAAEAGLEELLAHVKQLKRGAMRLTIYFFGTTKAAYRKKRR